MATIQRSSRSKRRMMNEINVVPYIDVMLVLLVIFMVTSPMISTGVVDLPSMGKSNQVPTAPIEITIQSDKLMTVRIRDAKHPDEHRVNQDALIKFVKDQQLLNPDQPVIISADRNVKYDTVLTVMDALQKQNVKRVGLMVRTTGV
ncbi:MAG: protein TolR [Burkholderiaceae bacterium]|nr:MAG: protein TolR [Burkholderiaceae bacterium]